MLPWYREFVTGFHKRKQERRKKAKKSVHPTLSLRTLEMRSIDGALC